ncbi:hypothetical protein [Mucilaginibacter flavidus]|uniref:hypothetical protein n=1 Tax=Mucilaginibacter flavidus TaxID=2949309 RepID=UPI0020931ECF|nr:hypothetical protein [Mucilaginibacter flavidus]MCO5951126.1 hypothetical protein [Mucilaginibacter flavidus]
MKKYILGVVALLILASATLPSCSVEYRERHGRGHDNGNGRGHDHDNGHGGDHHYRNN